MIHSFTFCTFLIKSLTQPSNVLFTDAITTQLPHLVIGLQLGFVAIKIWGWH